MFILFGALVALTVSKNHRGQTFRAIAIVLPVALVTRIGVDWLLGSRYPLSFFASYLPGDSDPSPSFDAGFSIVQESNGPVELGALEIGLDSLWPYFVLALIFYLPPWLYSLKRLASGKGEQNLQMGLFAVSTAALGMLAVSWAFGIRATMVGDDHTERILMRYSEFLIPLVLVILSLLISRERVTDNSWLFGATPIFLGVIAVFAGGLSGLSIQASDSLIVSSLSGFFLWQLMIAVGLAVLFYSARAKTQATTYVAASVLTAGLVITSSVHMSGMGQFYVDERESYAEIVQATKELGEEDIVFIANRRAVASYLLLTTGEFEAHYGLIGGYSEVPESWLSGFDYALIAQEIYPPRDSQELLSRGTNSLYKLRSSPSIYEDIYTESPAVEEFGNAGVITEWGYWVDGGQTEILFKETLSPGSRVIVSVIRHQETQESSIELVINNEESLVAELPNAGEIYELELKVGTSGMQSLDLNYSDAYQVIGNEGMGFYTFGIGTVRVLQ